MRLEPLSRRTPCTGCRRRWALAVNDVGMPLCAPCCGLLLVKTLLSQPSIPGDREQRQVLLAIEAALSLALEADVLPELVEPTEGQEEQP